MGFITGGAGSCYEIKLTTRLHLEPRLIIPEIVTPLPLSSEWRVTLLLFCPHRSGKGKGKSHPRTVHEDQGRGVGVYTFLTSALEGVGGQRHAPASLLLRKTRYQLYRRLGGSQGRSGRVGKNLAPPPTGFDHRTVQIEPIDVRKCLLSFGAEPFVFQDAIQKFKDQDI